MAALHGNPLVGQGTGHECSGARTGFEVTFSVKLGIGGKDGNARDFQFCRERATGRHFLARAQVAPHNGGTKSLIDLLVERLTVSSIERNYWRESAGYSSHL